MVSVHRGPGRRDASHEVGPKPPFLTVGCWLWASLSVEVRGLPASEK